MMKLKNSIKRKFNLHYFDVTVENDNLIFKLHNPTPFSKTFLIIKHHETGKRISKEIKESNATLNINEMISFDELGIFDVYLQTTIKGKRFLKRSQFKSENKNRIIFDENNEFIFKSVNKNSFLSFELRKNYDESSIDITEVYGEDISDIIQENQNTNKNFEYRLSAIVLVYNGGELLRECINSLVNQTMEGLEIILINDKSTDDSLDICKEFASQHNNIRIIDKKENHGLATSANIGIKIAKGEYVILVDNDDIVPCDAYEKLFNKAKEVNADISIGQANLLYGDYQTEMHDVERKVLEREMVIDNICEFPSLFNDAFYWNKIIRKSLLIDNAIYLPTGMIYADRKFCHMAYIHAHKISIIPDCVYIWRIRTQDNDKSLSNRKREADNYINRIDSYELELDKLISTYPDYFKILMRRVIIPVRGLLESNDFKSVFFEKGVKFLKRECGKLDDVYNNSFDNWDNIILYLLLNDHVKELYEFLKLHIQNEREIVNKNNKSYWNLFLLKKNIVPDEILEIKSMMPPFLNIEKVLINDKYILFDGISLPRYLKTERCEINFVGKTDCNGVLNDNILSYEIIPKDLNDNIFHLKIPTSDLSHFEAYDLFFKTYYEDRLSDNFRIKTECLKNIEQTSKDIFLGITKTNHISIISQNLNDMVNIESDENIVKFILCNPNSFRHEIKIFIQNDLTKEKTMLSQINKNTYIIKWDYFADKNTTYSFYITCFDKQVNDKNLKLNLKNMHQFNDIDLNDKIIFSDDKNDLKLCIK